jgi:hypothetical protein
MKKLIILFVFIFMSVITANATTVLYRISSNEVVDISVIHKTDFSVDLSYYGVLVDPPLTDGAQWLSPAPDYQNGVLGYAKINDNGVIRNATQAEIDTFQPAELDDRNQNEADQAIDYFQNHKQFRRIMTAFAAILVDEINILRSQHGLPVRTLQQLKTAIENRISKDD